jgi:hypothetical protein
MEDREEDSKRFEGSRFSRARGLILLKTYFHPDDAPDVMPLPVDPLILGEQRQ